jgi:hypothetical protein
LSVNNRSEINWEKFPDYKGSHFVRDPRDLIVSGYYYHLWCNEAWCNNARFDWTKIVEHPYYSAYIENNQKKYPLNISYKEYLKQLDKETGMVLELIWRDFYFDHMDNWNYHNPQIIELKYEEIVNNEVECFRKIFKHYEFSEELINRGLEIAESLSLKNKSKKKKRHTRKGTISQWKQEFSPWIKSIFKENYNNLLIKLDYEKYLNW